MQRATQSKELSTLMDEILTKNYNYFTPANYVIVSRTAVGTLNMTPNYTNLFIHLLEQYIFYNTPTRLSTRKSKAEFHRLLLKH